MRPADAAPPQCGKRFNNAMRSVFGAFGSRPGCVSRGLFLKATRLSLVFTEIGEIRILGNLKKPTNNNADQGDWFISADKAREWQRQQDENEARICR